GRLAILHLVQLGDAVDHHGDLVAEVLAELVQRVGRVLHGVVQQRRSECGGGHPQLGEDRGDREGVGDVGVAALAHLAPVGPLRDVVRPLDELQVGLGVGGLDGAQQRLQHRVGAGAGPSQAGQPGADAVAGVGGGLRDVLTHVPIVGSAAGSSAFRPCRAAQSVSSAWTIVPASFSRPCRKPSSSTTSTATTAPPHRSTSSTAAAAVPPVASTSSTTSTRWPSRIESVCSSTVAVPYSSV